MNAIKLEFRCLEIKNKKSERPRVRIPREPKILRSVSWLNITFCRGVWQCQYVRHTCSLTFICICARCTGSNKWKKKKIRGKLVFAFSCRVQPKTCFERSLCRKLFSNYLNRDLIRTAGGFVKNVFYLLQDEIRSRNSLDRDPASWSRRIRWIFIFAQTKNLVPDEFLFLFVAANFFLPHQKWKKVDVWWRLSSCWCQQTEQLDEN